MGGAYQPREYAVFRRLDGNVVFGLALPAVLAVAAAMLFGVVVFFALDEIKVPATVELSYEEQAGMRERYAAMCAAASYVEQKASLPEGEWELKLGATRKYALAGYAEEEIESLARQAAEAGITPGMTTAEATALAPDTRPGEVSAIPAFERGALCAIPALLTLALKFDYKGICLERELAAAIEWKRRRRTCLHAGRRDS